MTDLELYEEIVRLSRCGDAYVLATVVAHGGSSPRKAGAKMLIRKDGSSIGSIGGGRVEQETIAAGLQALTAGASRLLEFVLTEEHGFVCGGRMTVFVEPCGQRPLLVLFGAGHVGRAIAPLASGCGFRVTVVDERPDCSVHDLLPGADRILCCPVSEAFEQLHFDRETSVIIATPGHLSDFDAVRGCLATDAGFIGLLGSRRKREALMQTLGQEGFDSEQCSRIVTPVGLDIGAQTPEEIAVSIVAQLISLKNKA
jgi:xanthine dehydrogenase accessory factor